MKKLLIKYFFFFNINIFTTEKYTDHYRKKNNSHSSKTLPSLISLKKKRHSNIRNSIDLEKEDLTQSRKEYQKMKNTDGFKDRNTTDRYRKNKFCNLCKDASDNKNISSEKILKNSSKKKLKKNISSERIKTDTISKNKPLKIQKNSQVENKHIPYNASLLLKRKSNTLKQNTNESNSFVSNNKTLPNFFNNETFTKNENQQSTEKKEKIPKKRKAGFITNLESKNQSSDLDDCLNNQLIYIQKLDEKIKYLESKMNFNDKKESINNESFEEKEYVLLKYLNKNNKEELTHNKEIESVNQEESLLLSRSASSQEESLILSKSASYQEESLNDFTFIKEIDDSYKEYYNSKEIDDSYKEYYNSKEIDDSYKEYYNSILLDKLNTIKKLLEGMRFYLNFQESQKKFNIELLLKKNKEENSLISKQKINEKFNDWSHLILEIYGLNNKFNTLKRIQEEKIIKNNKISFDDQKKEINQIDKLNDKCNKIYNKIANVYEYLISL
jgi:hypothetical protein